MSEADRSLMAQVVEGDTTAFNEVVHRYYRTLYRLGMGWLGDPELAEELTQDVLLKVWKNAHSYRGESSLARWITVIAHRHAISLRRKRHLHHWVSLDWVWPPPMVPDTSESNALLDTLAPVLLSLQLLDPISRDILVLKEIDGWSHLEIATHFNIPSGTVRSKLSRAKTFIKHRHPELGESHESVI